MSDQGHTSSIDRTTKALLLAIALGLWANAAKDFAQPVIANTQPDLLSVATDINKELRQITLGTCVNPKICGR